MKIETKERAFLIDAIFIILLIFDDTVNMSVYSLGLLAFAALIMLVLDPVYLLIPSLLTCLIQSYFLITPTLSFSRVLSLMYIIGCFIHQRHYLKLDRVTGFLVIFTIYHLLSILWSVSGTYSEPVSFAIGMTMVLFMYSSDLDRDTLDTLLKLIYFTAYAFGLFIIILTFVKSGQIISSQTVFDESLNANTICSTLAIFASIIYAKTFSQKNTRKKWDYVFILLCTITVLIAGSRTSLLAIVVVLLVLPIFRGKGKNIDLKKFFGAIILVGIVVGILYYIMLQNDDLYARFTLATTTTTSIDRRVYIWEALWNHVIPSHLFLGIGYGINNVRMAVAPYVDMVYHSHNMFLAILSETGIFGLVQYVILIFYMLKELRKSNDQGAIVVLSIILIGLVVGIGEEIINRRWFWLNIGFGLMFMRNSYLLSQDE